MFCVDVVKSIDYDVDLDFLLISPKTPSKPVDVDKSVGEVTRSSQILSSFDDDCLVTPNRLPPADTAAKIPLVDRSTKPSSASPMLNSTSSNVKPSLASLSNTVSEPAVNINHDVSSVNDRVSDRPNNTSEQRSSSSVRPASVDVAARPSVPVAPDRSTKPAMASSDVTAQLDKEHAELSQLRARKKQEASDVANLMREKRKLEMEMERKLQQLLISK